MINGPFALSLSKGRLYPPYCSSRFSAIRRLTCRRSSSLISNQRETSSNVRRQLRQTSSPSTVVQWPMQGESAVISRASWEMCTDDPNRLIKRPFALSIRTATYIHYTGRVALSSCDNHAIASSRDEPHISAEGCNPRQNAGRSGVPNTLQRSSSSRRTHGTPAGLPFGMPGRGEVIEGAMQQAAQWGRQTRVFILK